MTTGDIQEGVQIAQVAAPIIEQLVTFLVGLFKKHAPAATPDQIEKGTTVAAHEVLTSIADASGNEVPQVAHVVAAVQTAIAAPAPEPVQLPAPVQIVNTGATAGQIRSLLTEHADLLLDDIAKMLVPLAPVAQAPATAAIATAPVAEAVAAKIPAEGVVFRGR